jgi:uroporphyrinogen decarboxylase
MTSRERVRGAMRRTPIDRLPIFMWFHPATTQRLSAAFGVPAETIARFMGNDVAQTWVGNNAAMEGIVHEYEGETHTDHWGITWVKEGPFNQVLHSPLATADADACRSYTFPHDAIPSLVGLMDAAAGGEQDMFLGCDVSPCLFEFLCRLQGMERATEDLAADPSTTSMLLEKAADFGVALARAACARYPLDWLWTGDDVAGQTAMIMSPAVWRRMIKPHLARIVAVGKEHGVPVAYHCCGAVRPIIPDLIEIGIDVLNPVQTTCPGMDPVELKNEYGRDLTFMGGIDTVSLLPHGTPAEVYDATRRLIDVLARDGGYILSASHTVPPETPIENILAMYRAAGRSLFPTTTTLQEDVP